MRQDAEQGLTAARVNRLVEAECSQIAPGNSSDEAEAQLTEAVPDATDTDTRDLLESGEIDVMRFMTGDIDVSYYLKTGQLPAFAGETVERRKDKKRQIRDRAKMYYME